MATPPSSRTVLFIPEKLEDVQRKGQRGRKRKAVDDQLEKARERFDFLCC